MINPPFRDLRAFLKVLRSRGELRTISAPVDPRLELAEIHRRVVSAHGPALFFSNVLGSRYPVVTNLFGTRDRVELAFGSNGRELVQAAVELIHALPKSPLKSLWEQRSLLSRAARLGIGTSSRAPVLSRVSHPADLDSLPVITSWPLDGGPFFTLPLVYTEEPDTGVHNLGIYRMHRYDSRRTGMHFQIGKGGGYHLARAAELKQKLPVNVFLGGPPVAILAAIAPLPENVPELLLASFLMSDKSFMHRSSHSPLPYLAESEFVLIGTVDPAEQHPEGPFGDHYGYYSLEHDFPVFRCDTLLAREDAIYPATVVGKPRQEDYYIGNYLQDLLSPLFPLAMPGVRALWSYGETGFHSLAAACVKQRYKREAMTSAFRILGEGQLALTKFLLVVDELIELRSFREVLTHILARADFRTDLYVFSNLSMDTLDYTGPRLNEGSKGVLLGVGPPIRELRVAFSGQLPNGVSDAQLFTPGCLVLTGTGYAEAKDLPKALAESEALKDWPLVILADDADQCVRSEASFLWTVFTRFEPAADIHSAGVELQRFHPVINPPVVIDCRMKPWYPAEVKADDETVKLVDSRWEQY